MQRILLLYQTEGASLLRHDIATLDLEVEAVSLPEAETALAQPGLDALIVEAATNLDETRRLLDAPSRPRLPLLLVMRPDQLAGLDPTWPIDDMIVMPVIPEELTLRLRRAIWGKTGL